MGMRLPEILQGLVERWQEVFARKLGRVAALPAPDNQDDPDASGKIELVGKFAVARNKVAAALGIVQSLQPTTTDEQLYELLNTILLANDGLGETMESLLRYICEPAIAEYKKAEAAIKENDRLIVEYQSEVKAATTEEGKDFYRSRIKDLEGENMKLRMAQYKILLKLSALFGINDQVKQIQVTQKGEITKAQKELESRKKRRDALRTVMERKKVTSEITRFADEGIDKIIEDKAGPVVELVTAAVGRHLANLHELTESFPTDLDGLEDSGRAIAVLERLAADVTQRFESMPTDELNLLKGALAGVTPSEADIGRARDSILAKVEKVIGPISPVAGPVAEAAEVEPSTGDQPEKPPHERITLNANGKYVLPRFDKYFMEAQGIYDIIDYEVGNIPVVKKLIGKLYRICQDTAPQLFELRKRKFLERMIDYREIASKLKYLEDIGGDLDVELVDDSTFIVYNSYPLFKVTYDRDSEMYFDPAKKSKPRGNASHIAAHFGGRLLPSDQMSLDIASRMGDEAPCFFINSSDQPGKCRYIIPYKVDPAIVILEPRASTIAACVIAFYFPLATANEDKVIEEISSETNGL